MAVQPGWGALLLGNTLFLRDNRRNGTVPITKIASPGTGNDAWPLIRQIRIFAILDINYAILPGTLVKKLNYCATDY